MLARQMLMLCEPRAISTKKLIGLVRAGDEGICPDLPLETKQMKLQTSMRCLREHSYERSPLPVTGQSCHGAALFAQANLFDASL
jgi:hypothetical protein